MRRALACLLLMVLVGPAKAHDGTRPHYFLMTQVQIHESVLSIDVWLERPTADVTREFREMFENDPEAAEEQEGAFNRFNFHRMIDAMTVSLDGQELLPEWEASPLENNGRGNDKYFTWAITAGMPVPDDLTTMDLRVENHLFEGEHIFLSCYVEVDGDWKVEFDSARATIEDSGVEVHGQESGVSWTHDASVRSWELILGR